ncbi:MAG: hypothetical protein PVH92_06640 [Anaerolineales bacterium]|jgi:hypothetical protein
MEAIQNFLDKRTAIIIAVALIFGILLGVLYAWVLNPVEWVNGTPEDLREDLREEYLRMVVDSYELNGNAEKALDRYNELGEFKDEALAQVAEVPEDVSPSALQKFQALVAVEVPVVESETGETDLEEPMEGQPAEGETGESEEPVEGETAVVPETMEEETAERTGASRFILPVCGATLLLGALLGLALLLRRRIEVRESEFDEAFEQQDMGSAMDFESVEPYEELAEVVEQPLATFRTTYTLGDDLYDDSFSIESPATGDFLGECGVGITHAMSVGEPKKVSAFEVWLFDKNDIQTVTKILLSKYAYSDEDTRGTLAAKGDMILAESGETVVLETASLQVEARIVDLSYGEGALPSESFFDRLTIELKARSKSM